MKAWTKFICWLKDLFDPYNPTIAVVLGVLFFGWLIIKYYIL